MSSSNAAPPSPIRSASLALETESKDSTRRRQAVVVATDVEQKSKPHSELASPAQANGRDLAHSLRREVVGVCGPKDPLARGGIEARSRPRRSVPKSEKPRWVTVVNVLTKNAILFMVLFWLWQAIRRWDYGHVPGSDASFAAMDLERRVSEIEALFTKTTKMTQVQLDVMERKSQQMAERVAGVEKNLESLDSRTSSLDRFLSELRDAKFLTKREFEMFADDVKQSMSVVQSSKGFGLDDISRYAREVVIKEIEKHAADGIGTVDYALASGGAKVLKHSETFTFGKPGSWLPVKRSRSDVHANAHKMLEPSFGEPGQCFALKGSCGFVDIKLRTGIIPDSITLEHVAKSTAYDRSSAPKDCRVWGWFEGPEDVPISEYDKMSLLKEFSYDLNASNIQTFATEMASASIITMVRLEFISNHGSSSHTCIYRFRVHGREPDQLLKDNNEL